MLGFSCSFAYLGPRDPSPVPPDDRFRHTNWPIVRNVPISLAGLGQRENGSWNTTIES